MGDNSCLSDGRRLYLLAITSSGLCCGQSTKRKRRLMKAVLIVPSPAGGQIGVHELPDPKPAASEVLVRVHAAGLNRGEIGVRKGLKSGNPQQNGIEFAGEVIALGADASGVKTGDRVMGHWRGGQ